MKAPKSALLLVSAIAFACSDQNNASAGNGIGSFDIAIDGNLYGSIDVHSATSLPEVPENAESSIISRTVSSMLVDMTKVPQDGPRILSFMDDSVADETDASEYGVSAQALTLCGNGTAGPSIAIFYSSTPGQSGQKYSWMPEFSQSLYWASYGEKTADGVYKSSWGCGTAKKIPNNCTLVLNADGTTSSCCGFPYLQVSTVNTTSDPYFPDCPLF